MNGSLRDLRPGGNRMGRSDEEPDVVILLDTARRSEESDDQHSKRGNKEHQRFHWSRMQETRLRASWLSPARANLVAKGTQGVGDR